MRAATTQSREGRSPRLKPLHLGFVVDVYAEDERHEGKQQANERAKHEPGNNAPESAEEHFSESNFEIELRPPTFTQFVQLALPLLAFLGNFAEPPRQAPPTAKAHPAERVDPDRINGANIDGGGQHRAGGYRCRPTRPSCLRAVG